MKRRKKKVKSSRNEMGLVEHLSELRNRIMIIVGVLCVITVISFNYSTDIVKILVEIAEEMGYQLVYLAPGELFAQYIKMSIVIGIVFSSPIILYQVWAFIRPGLEKSENIVVFLSLLAGLLCFVIGSLFGFFIAMPIMLSFFINVDQHQAVTATISIQNYLNFIMSTLITFGIVFEMPVITVLLSQLGLLKPQWLTKSRKVVIVIIFIIGALITPPDIVSQILVSIPIFILYEFSVIICKVINSRKIKKEKELDCEDIL